MVPKKLHVGDIGRELELIGTLGKKLGTRMVVSGRWRYPKFNPKTWSIRFLVESIDNQKLDPPVEFDVNQVNIADAKGEPKHAACGQFLKSLFFVLRHVWLAQKHQNAVSAC